MATPGVEDQLHAIQQQLDLIQHELQVRNRDLAEMQELKADLTVILKDVMRTAIVELDDVAPFLRTGDLLTLSKRLLRNTSRISSSLSKLESASDFFIDARPIGHDLFHRVIQKLDELERKGYFKIGADLQRTLDALVRLLVSKNVLSIIGSALETANRLQANEVERYSLWRVVKATRTPEMQRLMGILMAFVKSFAAELDGTPQPLNDIEEPDAASRDRQ